MLSIATIAAVLASLVSPLLLIAVLAVNAVLIFGLGGRVHGLVEDLRRACDLAVAGRLARLRSPERIPQLDALAAAGDIVRAAHRSFRGFALFQYDPFGIGTWLNLLCLVEWIAYALGRTGSARDRPKNIRAPIRRVRLVRRVGDVDFPG